jgi:hemoglobin-like flavoprotein
MTPEQLETVAQTAEVVEADAERFSTVFYDHLFTNWPAMRALFPDDLTAQRVKLADEIVFLAEVASDFDGFAARTRELGARHRHYGVKVDDYAAVESALLAGLASVLGDGFTPEVSAAWRRLYTILVETMLDGARAGTFSEP